METQQLKEEIVDFNKKEVVVEFNNKKPNLKVLIPAIFIIPLIGTGVMSLTNQSLGLIVDTILFGGVFLFSLKKNKSVI
jgi:hypothetical protein